MRFNNKVSLIASLVLLISTQARAAPPSADQAGSCPQTYPTSVVADYVLGCMLALKISREMERRLRAAFGTTDTNPHAITLPDALASLSRLCLLHYPIDADTTLTRLPRPDARQTEILTALGVALPEK